LSETSTLAGHAFVKNQKISALFDEAFVFGRQPVSKVSETLRKFDGHIM